jgi:hypothetical protein
LEYKVERLQSNGTDGLAIAHGRIAAPGFHCGHGGFIEPFETAAVNDLCHMNVTFFIQLYP